MTELERLIIGELQQDLPIVPKPYALIAERLPVNEKELLRQIQSMLERGIIRKVGAVLRHRKVGIQANALCVWQVPEEKVAAVGGLFAALPAVTHCYERETYGKWPYNLYTMVHAPTRQACEAQINAMRDMSGVRIYQLLYSTQELKKTSMRYFK